jgi:hypothetical protein
LDGDWSGRWDDVIDPTACGIWTDSIGGDTTLVAVETSTSGLHSEAIQLHDVALRPALGWLLVSANPAERANHQHVAEIL